MRDADLSTTGVANDEARVAEVVREIMAVELESEDGLRYNAGTIRTEIIREDAEYSGVRVKLEARWRRLSGTI